MREALLDFDLKRERREQCGDLSLGGRSSSAPEVILAHSAQVAGAMFRQTRAIPIVFVNVSDPIGAGFIVSLAQPGGNFTGVLHYEVGIVGKWLAMLKELAPNLTRVALMSDPKSPARSNALPEAIQTRVRRRITTRKLAN